MSAVCHVCGGFGTVGRRAVECRDCNGEGYLCVPVGQSKGMSFIEIGFSTAIGFLIAYITVAIVMPAFGHHVSPSQNFWITTIFTVVSIVRGYCVRRLFNAMHR
jgi:hypothetical protein